MTKVVRLIMFLTLTFGPLCLQAEAFTNPEYEADKGQPATCPDPGNQVMSDSWSFIACNCTSYVAWRLNEHWKAIVPSSDIRFWNQYRASDPRFKSDRWSHASYWGYRARELGITVDNTPKAGAVGWKDSNAYGAANEGHVFFVEAVSGNQVKISEYNADGDYAYRETWISASNVSGYIHFTPAHLDYLKSLYNQSDTAYLEVLYYQEECYLTGLCDASGEGAGSSS